MLGAVVVLATLVLASAFASAAVIPLGRTAEARLAGTSPRRRARALLALGLLPTAAALAAGALATAAWLAHEPKGTGERPGAVLLLLATAALVMIACGLGRGLRALWATRRLVAQWLPGAEAVSLRGAPAPAFRIHHPFPAVCVVGIQQPRLFVAGQVVDALSPAELAAVLAHEAGHLNARDNLKGLLLRFALDPLAWCRRGADLEQAWREAAEASADQAVSRGNRAGRGLELASALVKVARLAPPSARLAVPVPALHDGEDLAGRVLRLLEPPPPAEAAAPVASRPILVGGSAAIVALSVPCLPEALRSVHTILELLVRNLP